ncbi:MAG: RNA ligase, partial [uncultured Sulfurovum sp.]
MKRFISFGSIEQFRNIVKNIETTARYSGQDENGEPIFDEKLVLPKVIANISEKIHGTNASVCYGERDGFWVQSRKNIINVEEDNADCALKAYEHQEAWMKLIRNLAEFYKIDLNKQIVSLYYEWSGGNIQKKTALTGLAKRAMLFQHFKVSPLEPSLEDETSAYWLETRITDEWVSDVEADIFNIMNFPTYEIEINFEEPLLSQNKMIALVENEIEPSSPVGRKFGVEGNIGEGIVVTFMFQGNLYRFKVKGEKHAKRVKKLKVQQPIDTLKEQKKIDFVNNYACRTWRLEQIYNEIFDVINGGVGDIKKMGQYLKAFHADVMKEEGD